VFVRILASQSGARGRMFSDVAATRAPFL
jgi:hypothetical protein